jgi:hypothetical protein
MVFLWLEHFSFRFLFIAVLRTQIRIIMGSCIPDPLQSEKQDPDPHPHQSEKVEALEGRFGALESPNLKNEW